MHVQLVTEEATDLKGSREEDWQVVGEGQGRETCCNSIINSQIK